MVKFGPAVYQWLFLIVGICAAIMALMTALGAKPPASGLAYVILLGGLSCIAFAAHECERENEALKNQLNKTITPAEWKEIEDGD